VSKISCLSWFVSCQVIIFKVLQASQIAMPIKGLLVIRNS
jgi:hypothetical protein